jgi:murein DD-endopeptidase MepM/ murein hydrolase activator NlpD
MIKNFLRKLIKQPLISPVSNLKSEILKKTSEKSETIAKKPIVTEPVKTNELIITQPFKGISHRGVDLRSASLSPFKLLPVVMCEDGVVLRKGIDGLGNDFLVVKCGEHEIKYIHVTFNANYQPGENIPGGVEIGFTQIKQVIGRGNSSAHHLHFEVWRDGSPIDPVEYFHDKKMRYKFI